jgi:hypothetical protein
MRGARTESRSRADGAAIDGTKLREVKEGPCEAARVR